MRKMQVLGIELQDHTVREAMKKTDAFLRDGKVSTIAYITMRGLMEAEESQERQDFLRELDLTVPADSDILRAAGIATRNRVREVDNDEFLTEFLRKIVRGRQTDGIFVDQYTGTAAAASGWASQLSGKSADHRKLFSG